MNDEYIVLTKPVHLSTEKEVQEFFRNVDKFAEVIKWNSRKEKDFDYWVRE